MSKKSELLKELGWNEELIQHFMIDDSDYSSEEEKELKTEVYETNSLTFTYNAGTNGFYTK